MKKRKKIEITSDDYTSDVIETIERNVKRIREKRKIPVEELIPTGSTLYNCSLSDNHLGGYSIGKFSNLIGDRHAGKSIIALNMLAECAHQKRFKDYDLIYDDVEVANEFDIKYLFGKTAADRIILDIISDTTEDFYGNIYRKIRNKKPFIYVLDTFDAIATEEDKERAVQFAEKKKRDGTYGTSKPKLASEIFRTIKSDLKNLEAFLLPISQTRDNIGFGAQFKPKIRAGGKALEFYACHESWLSIVGQEKDKGVPIGAITECKNSKNKLTGKRREVPIYIYNDYGIDDISANIDFLVDQGHWKKEAAKSNPSEEKKRGRKKNTESSIIVASDFDIRGVKRKIIYEIEERKIAKTLAEIVGDVWKEREDSIRLDRRPRYE